jgi:hypothetical protein
MLPTSARAVSVVLFFVLGRPSSTEAQTPIPPFPVDIAGEAGGSPALEATLRDAVSSQPVELQIARVARIEAEAVIRAPGDGRAPPPLGRSFLDLSHPARATVYVVDGSRERVLIRHLPRRQNPEILHEQLGRIVATAIEALLAGSFARSSEPVADIDPPPSRLVPEPKPDSQVVAVPLELVRPPGSLVVTARLGASYEIGLYGSGLTWVHGPALEGVLSAGSRSLRPTLWLTGQYRWPVVTERPPVGFRIGATALRLLGGIEMDLGSRLGLEIGAGLGVDSVSLEPRRPVGAGDDLWLAPRQSFLVGLGRVMAGARWRLAAHVSGHLLLLADLDLSRTRLLFQGDRRNEAVFNLYRVRPGLAFTLSVP